MRVLTTVTRRSRYGAARQALSKVVFALTWACLCLVLAGCARLGWPEISRMNREATFVHHLGKWHLDGKPPIKVKDVAHFRSLLRDPAPKSLVINDSILDRREHAILCADILVRDIRVKRLAIRVHHVSRPMEQALFCLDRLPLEYLSLDAYSSSECDPLDLESLFRKLDLRGLALVGYEMGAAPITPVNAPQLEELHLIHPRTVNRSSWEADRTAFLEVVASIASLRTLTFYVGGPGWTVEQLRPLTRLARLTHLELDLDAPAAAISLLISSLPALERVNVPYEADDSVAATLAEAHNLEALQLGRTRMTDDGMASITRAQGLKELVLIYTEFSDRALSRLAALVQLKRLHIYNQQHLMRDSVLAISHLTHLEELEFDWTEVDPRFLDHLRNLTQLRTLRIETRTPLACDSVRFLDRLPRLESLRINMEPECLTHLRHMKHLRVLDIVADYHDGRRSSHVITGPLAANIADLPIESLTIGLIDDAAAIRLGKMKMLRTLHASFDQVSPRVRRWHSAMRRLRDRARAPPLMRR
jgi:hypothetical protein